MSTPHTWEWCSSTRPLLRCAPHPVGARGCPRSPSPGGVGQATGRPRPHAYRVHLARTGGHRRADHIGLPGWDNLRYEVTEDPSPGNDGSRWQHTPNLGVHHATMSASGDLLIGRTTCARS